jgi:lipoate-protein ligase A
MGAFEGEIQEWRLLRHGPASGAWNMAVDEAVARAVGAGGAPPTLRFYAWEAPTVSLGYLQRMPGGVDLSACRRRGVGLVRRVTGGRAVLHDREITYSVAVALSGAWRGLSVAQAFGRLGRGLIAGLKRLGICGALGESGAGLPDGRGAAACFLARRLPAILVDGRKLIGSAQRRWEQSLLQHGSLLLAFDSGLHQAIFPAWPRADPTAGVTCLQTLLGDLPPMGDVVAGLAAGWSEAFGASCLPGDLTPAEAREAAQLARNRYGSEHWTHQR